MPREIDRDTTGLTTGNKQHGLTNYMNLPMLLGRPEDVVPKALEAMTPDEQDHFAQLAEDLQSSYPSLSNVQAAHMALASMVMEQSLAFARRRGFQNLDENNVAALEWARKVYNQNVNEALKRADKPDVESNWMKDLESFELERETRPDGTEVKRMKGKLRAKEIQQHDPMLDVTATVQEEEPTDE